VDLPTYTNIWRIEKRLYKLYDFRLPAPLPITWIAVFTGITVPYVVFLIAIGLPFNHNLVWLYVLPPGVLTWLTTRPVIESKRLPELVSSQLRYIAEPRAWCRMAPFAEKDDILVSARVWHKHPPKARPRKAKAKVTLSPVEQAASATGRAGTARQAAEAAEKTPPRVPAPPIKTRPSTARRVPAQLKASRGPAQLKAGRGPARPPAPAQPSVPAQPSASAPSVLARHLRQKHPSQKHPSQKHPSQKHPSQKCFSLRCTSPTHPVRPHPLRMCVSRR
jgi:hypothetical protein